MLTVRRVTDLDLRRAAGRPEAVLGHVDLHATADDVAARAQPGALLELQPESHRFRQDPVDGPRQPGRLEYDQADAGPAGVRCEPAQRFVMPGADPPRQVDHEQVYATPGNECSGERPSLGEIRRPENEQPAQIDAACHRLERVEAAAQVEEGDDAATRLRLGQAVQRERRLAARAQATKRDADTAWQTTGAEQRVEMREAGGHDVVRQCREPRPVLRQRGKRQGTGHAGLRVVRVPAETYHGTAPARFETCQRARQGRTCGRQDWA